MPKKKAGRVRLKDKISQAPPPEWHRPPARREQLIASFGRRFWFAAGILDKRATKKRFVTPDDPEVGLLRALRGVDPSDPTTWPTLRELKLATAISERTIKKIIVGSTPTKGEIVQIPLPQIQPTRCVPETFWTASRDERIIRQSLQKLF